MRLMASEVNNEQECYEEKGSANSTQGNATCPSAWDGLFCWPAATAGSTVTRSCTSIFPFLPSSSAIADDPSIAFRQCGDDGKWLRNGWTNYSECEQLSIRVEQTGIFSQWIVSLIVFVGSLLSIATLTAALVIFSYFRSLQCPRIRVHRQLVLSLLLHAFLMLAVSGAALWPETMGRLLIHSALTCRGVLLLRTYCSMASVHWMFVEGLLLHSSITVSVFRRSHPFLLYHTIGWGVPCICVFIWVLLMSLAWDGESVCWKGYGRSPFIWLVTGPMMFTLLVNAVFLVNIIRILITKMRTNVAIETKQIKKTVRATAFLFPLLGVSHLLFCINPRGDWEPLYMLLNALLQSTQGVFVSILYCFLNSEVQVVLATAYTRRRSSAWNRSSRMFGTSITTTVPPVSEPRVVSKGGKAETAFNAC